MKMKVKALIYNDMSEIIGIKLIDSDDKIIYFDIDELLNKLNNCEIDIDNRYINRRLEKRNFNDKDINSIKTDSSIDIEYIFSDRRTKAETILNTWMDSSIYINSNTDIPYSHSVDSILYELPDRSRLENDKLTIDKIYVHKGRPFAFSTTVSSGLYELDSLIYYSINGLGDGLSRIFTNLESEYSGGVTDPEDSILVTEYDNIHPISVIDVKEDYMFILSKRYAITGKDDRITPELLKFYLDTIEKAELYFDKIELLGENFINYSFDVSAMNGKIPGTDISVIPKMSKDNGNIEVKFKYKSSEIKSFGIRTLRYDRRCKNLKIQFIGVSCKVNNDNLMIIKSRDIDMFLEFEVYDEDEHKANGSCNSRVFNHKITPLILDVSI